MQNAVTRIGVASGNPGTTAHRLERTPEEGHLTLCSVGYMLHRQTQQDNTAQTNTKH